MNAPFPMSKFHKLVMISTGGSTGKTTMVAQGASPLLPDVKILCVDEANVTAEDFGVPNCEKHSGDEFKRVYRALMETKGHVIVDVGGSKECKEFLAGMSAIGGSDKVTCFIIPSSPDPKDQGCALETIERLLMDGVDKSKIKVLFTKVRKSVTDEFQLLLSGMNDNGLEPDLDLMIQRSGLFDELMEHRLLISNIVADKTDYNDKAENRAEGDYTDYVGMHMRQQEAIRIVWPNLQAVFTKLLSEA